MTKTKNNNLKFIDLFAGIGGFHIAFENAGAKCVFVSEWDKFARQTYEHNFKKRNPEIFENNNFLKNMTLYRTYLNLFIPNEQPSFHIDGDNTVTCLYYLNPSLDPNEGGETQFFIEEEIRGIISKPGRLIVFDGRLLHRATSFKSHPRLTLAFKFV